MLAIIRMIVVLASICGLSGFALSYLKISTAPRIEEQVLTYVQGPAILKVFADIDNSPIAERKTFTLDGAKVTVFPGKKDGRLVAVALEHFGKGFGGDVGVMVGYDVNRDTLTGIGITTMKETPGLGTRVADPAFTGQFTGKPAGDHQPEKKGRASDEYKRNFWNAMRLQGNPYEIRNALQEGTDSEGGYLVPDEYERTLVQALEEENVFRRLAKVIQTSSGDRKIPIVTSHRCLAG